MKAIASCIEGFEDITILEIKEILKIKANKIIPSRIEFSPKSDSDIAKFIYNTRSSINVYLLLLKLTFKSKEDIIKNIKEINFNIRESFVVRCKREGSHDFVSNDIEREIGAIINNKTKVKVDLNDPFTTIFIDIIDDNCFVGIDYTGIKLSKREYKIKNIPNNLNSCIAYSLVRLADYSSKDFLLDPFARSCEIPIEAALFALDSPNCSRIKDKLFFNNFIKINFKDKIKKVKLNILAIDAQQNSLRAGEINAKLAGINKSIKFSRLEIEWLDTKLEKNTVDKVVTFPLYPTSTLPINKVEGLYNELFYNLEFILKKSGLIVLLTPVPDLIEKYSMKNKFKTIKKLNIKYMNQDFYVLTMKK